MKRVLVLPILILVTAACQDVGRITRPGGDRIEGRFDPALTVTASSGLNFQEVSAGWDHSCGVTTAGVAYCWGSNNSGRLGDGTNTNNNLPVPVSGGLIFQSVVAGINHSCGLTVAGLAHCWGNDGVGQLGDGSNTNSNVPVAVSGGLVLQSVGSPGTSTCGVTATGAAHCWGRGTSGQLGNGANTNSNVPVAVSGGLTFQSVSAGQFHGCGVTASGAAYCWGAGTTGQLGSGAYTNSNVPVAVFGGLTFQSLSVGESHTCGVASSGAAYCWGVGGSGRLGDGTTGDSNVPVAVSGGLTFQSVSAGTLHSCGVTTMGAAYCWGSNGGGRLGDGTTTGSNVPVAVTGGLTFLSVSASLFHSCGVTTSSVAYCWGPNLTGQLGDGTTTSSSVPKVVGGTADDEPPLASNSAGSSNPVAVGLPLIFTSIVDDTGLGDSNIASAEYSLDGGAYIAMAADDGAFDEVGEDVEASFSAPSEAGIYDLCVRWTDEPGNVGDPECIMLVVYDPSGGFVTGGGWIDSPAGAYRADASLTGKATFGFVSKYKKGAQVPTGNTEFQFRAGDLDFHGASYDFLVVNAGGTRAQFKGSGTINGEPAPTGDAFKFMIWATDDSPDTFRIKIWYEDGGEVVVYDNGVDQALGGGSIVVHKK